MERNKITIVAGSFGHFHKGHRKLLQAAVDTGNYVIVGLTSDTYGKITKHYDFPDFPTRKQRIDSFLREKKCGYEIRELKDNTGDSTNNPDYDTIVVSRETEKNGRIINEKRRKNGLREMKIIPVDLEMAEDFFPISSRRIESGEIDEDGRRLEPVKISVRTNINIGQNLVVGILSNAYQNARLDVNYEHDENTDDLRPEEFIRDRDFAFAILCDVSYDYESTFHLLRVKCTALDRYGVTTVGYGPSKIISDVVYHQYVRGDGMREEIFIENDGDALSNMVSQSFQMSLEPRKRPWDYDMMDYFQEQP